MVTHLYHVTNYTKMETCGIKELDCMDRGGKEKIFMDEKEILSQIYNGEDTLGGIRMVLLK